MADPEQLFFFRPVLAREDTDVTSFFLFSFPTQFVLKDFGRFVWIWLCYAHVAHTALCRFIRRPQGWYVFVSQFFFSSLKSFRLPIRPTRFSSLRSCSSCSSAASSLLRATPVSPSFLCAMWICSFTKQAKEDSEDVVGLFILLC